MQFIFDHTIALLVGGTLLAGLFMLQVRGQQTAIQAAQRYRVQTQTAGFAQTIERDVENIRTREQAEAAFGSYRFTLRQAAGGAYTEQATFVTLQDPALGPDSPAIVVSYTVAPTGETVEVDGLARPTYRLRRQTYERGGTLRDDGAAEGLIDFDLTALMNDGSTLSARGGTRNATSGAFDSEVPSLPRAVRVELVGATDAVGQRAADQRNTALTNASRQTRTVGLAAYGSTGGLPPVDTTAPEGMPPLPGDPPPPPPSTGGTIGSTGTTGSSSTTTTGSGGGNTGTRLPPPPRPTPPSGHEI